MNTETPEVKGGHNKVSAPKWFWIVSLLALAWFLMDTMAFSIRVFLLEESIKELPESHQNIYLDMPFWISIVFAIEVFGGLLGSIALLLKKKWALTGFAISLIGTLGQTSYIYFLSDATSVIGAMAIIMPLVAITLCLALIFFVKSAVSKSWI
jgi:hypothetical protein